MKPLRLNGRWLAVIITVPSNLKPSVTVAMNMAGVLAMPKEVTCKPLFTISSQSQALSCSPDNRESRPTATRRF